MGGLKETTMKVRLQQYAAQIQDCKSSGMTVQAWCDLNGIGIKTYYYRQRKVRKALLEMDKAELPAPEPPVSATFVKLPEISKDATTDASGITININGIKVEVSEDTSEEAIKRSLKVVLSLC